jgi:two-component system, NarL family, response regulator NreC
MLPEATPARTILLDPSPIFCKGISSGLDAGGHVTLARAQNLDEILQGQDVLFPNLALVGPDFLEHESLIICRELARHWPALKIIVFSRHVNDLLFQADAAHAGTSACLPPEAGEQECLSTIAAVMAGHQLFSREVMSLAFRPIELTAREREVLQLLAQGKTDREIADALVLSLATVRKHSHQILEKLDVHTRHEAVRRARRLGWV